MFEVMWPALAASWREDLALIDRELRERCKC
jgi:hypothetical protein